MPRHCSAVGCKSRDTTEVRKFGITFHRLPKKGNPRRTSWIINSCRKGPGGKGQWDPQSHFIYFCSKHFTPDSFELSGVSGYRRLKDDAIPTVFEIQPHERGTARRGAAKRSCRPQNVKNHISVKNFTNNKDSENQEIFNSERMLQKIPDDAGASSSEQRKGEKNQGQPQPQPSSEAAHTPVDDLTDPSFPQCPPSPSCYMKRLPPPPGFYLPKEHSYAQRCPLEWRKRYDKAIDSLEKTLQLLSAARRRENRLRNALFRLRENRLKSTPFRSQDGVKGKQDKGGRFSSWAAKKGQATKGKRDGGLESLEENSNEGAAVDIDNLKEGWHSQVQMGAKVLMEDEEGFCFYCGRNNDGNKVIGYNEAALGPDEVQGALVRCRPKGLKEVKKKVMVPKVLGGQRSERNTVPPVEHQSYYLYYCENDENEDTMQVVAMEMQPHKFNAEDKDSRDLQAHTGTIQQLAVLHPETEMQMLDTVPGPVQYSTSAQFQVLHQLQGLVLPDTDIKEKSELEIDPRGEQQFYLVQENDDHVLLTSVPTETSERGKVGSINEIVQHQSVLENFQLRVTEERAALPVKCDLLTPMEWGNSQVTHQPNLRPKVVGGDVRERLKEHLEGFQLQLSRSIHDELNPSRCGGVSSHN